jgi:LAO/AO transport system kinase
MKLTLKSVIEGFKDQHIATLAKAITLIESDLDDDRKLAKEVLKHFYSQSGKSLRLGISGTPGVGKSTFINSFGMKLIEEGHRVAVLAIDPTSVMTGGSILGDKTRMSELSSSDQAFIRPSPSKGQLGGVARKTKESLLLCEAFGFDTILVETVGVGQSEVQVTEMVDALVMLLQPGAGDELQGIKRGILELVDFVLVTKSDLNPELALQAKSHYENALAVLREHQDWKPPVIVTSSVTREGWNLWDQALKKFIHEKKMIGERRSAQQLSWFKNILIENSLLELEKKWQSSQMNDLKKQIMEEKLSVLEASEKSI